MKVFLSHSGADKDLARKLARDLTRANVDVWLDEWQLRVGEEFEQKIEQGLDEVEFVIVLLTKASVASDWVNREWRAKIQRETQTRRIAVVPVRGEECELPDFLGQRSHADISGGSYPLGLRHLLTILRYYSDDRRIADPSGTMDRPEFSDYNLPIVTPISLEIGRDLIPLFETATGSGGILDELAPRMRDALRAEFGFPFPGIRVRGHDFDMPPRSALILIDEIPEMVLEVPADTPDPAGFLFRSLHDVLRRTAPLFLDIDVSRRLVDDFAIAAPDLVAQTVPQIVSWYELTDVLQRLVDERIGIGDLRRILEALARRAPDMRDTVMLAEQARHALSGQITAALTHGRGSLPVLLMDGAIEELMGRAIQRTSSGSYLALAPEHTEAILAAVRATASSLVPDTTDVPILVHSVELRPFISKLVGLEFPALQVVSRQDLTGDVRIDMLGRIRLADTPGDPPPADDRTRA